jgi:HlyD family secretion protein
VLLRPGLLADVEVEIEKIPNALHVPKQAVFPRGNQNVVFVQGADGKFTQRNVQVLRQSETMMVLSAGVEPGETVALSDPTAQKKETNKSSGGEDQKGSTNAMKGFGGS